MKLFYSPTSPFVRKVMASAIALGLDDRIERVTADPWSVPADLAASNPLSQVPCLVTDDGLALFDSAVICEYLDATAGGGLFPTPGPDRWRALRQQALADSMLDAALLRRRAAMTPEEAMAPAGLARQQKRVARGVAALEADPPGDRLDIGAIGVACALGYLDFRFAEDEWRGAAPRLAAWFAEASRRPALERTAH